MAVLNEKVIAYLTVNSIDWVSGDYLTGEPSGEADQILYWNDSKLGPIPSDAQLDSAYAQYSAQQQTDSNKQKAVDILTATDWTAIPSVSDPVVSMPYLVNQAQFLAYRSAIRAIAVNPSADPVWPDAPIAQWS
jgi:hypothetical protein